MDYKPTKYKNHFKFEDIDAAFTAGNEDGMWGDFILEKGFAKEISAHYIFQAGDHMGGTVDFTCQKM